MKIRKIFYKWVYDPVYSLWYSIKDVGIDMVDLLKELKRPRTWSTILYVACFYAFLTRNYDLFRWLIPFIVLVYIIRQRVDGKYKTELRNKAILNGNDILLEDEYEKYKRECHFTKQEALDYPLWKEQEKKKLLENDKS